MADGKWVAGLTPEMPVAEAARLVLTSRFEGVRRWLPAATEKPYHDTETVHQLRVSTRRAAAALRVFADCVPRKELKATRRYLRLIRRAAGNARDWDVFRLGLATEKALATAAGKPTRDFLMGYAFGERSAAQAALDEMGPTAGLSFLRVADELPGLVSEPRGDNPPENLGVLAAQQFGELLETFDAAVQANPTDPTALHSLRIVGKRTRYALEIFADCFPPAFKQTVYPSVERVQEVLGTIQDANVSRDRLTMLRDRVKLAAPKEWPRLQKGFEGLLTATRARLPTGRKAFQAWRKGWVKLIASVEVEIVEAVGTETAA